MNLNNSPNNRMSILNESIQINMNNYLKNKNFICDKHGYDFNKYCKTCNQDLCAECEKDHKTHDIQDLFEIMVKRHELENFIQKKYEDVNIWEKNLKEMTNEKQKEIKQYMANIKKFIYNYDHKKKKKLFRS